MSGVVEKKGKTQVDGWLKLIARNYTLTVGIHEAEGASAKEIVEGQEPTGQSLAEVAEKHELGIGVPRRSFIVDWFEGQQKENESALRKIVENAIKRKTSPEIAIKRFGVWAVGQIQQRIADGIPPELSEATKEYKASLNLAGNAKDTPLILTGQLRSGIRSKVRSNKS